MDGQAPIFSKGLEIQSEEIVYSYESDIDYTPRIWERERQNKGDYHLDEILFVPCDVPSTSDMYAFAGKLIKVTGKNGNNIEESQRPYEPEEYEAWDEGMDWRNYQHRYMRVKTYSPTWAGDISRSWTFGNRWYYFFYEDRGNGGCGTGGWRWSAKDITATGTRTHRKYLRTCMRTTYSNKFDASKDIKARISYWKAPTGSAREYTYQFQAIIERNGYFYFRTHLNKPIQYKPWTTGTYSYTFMEVVTPADIDGFKEIRRISATLPFDGKGYTKATVDTTDTNGIATWSLLSTDDFNSLAFGRVSADTIDIKITDIDGTLLFELNNYIVFNEVDDETDLSYDSTVVLYTKKMIPADSIITIVVHGDVIEIGEILGAKSVDAGFTNLVFKNKFKDFSPKGQDDWGNWYYKDGVRVHVHSGTVDFPTPKYDQKNRLMMLIGGKKVIINSSDSFNNEAPDGRNIFDATMMIARFTSLELSTKASNKRLDTHSTYSFALEEIV